jgi:hypothetical protein
MSWRTLCLSATLFVAVFATFSAKIATAAETTRLPIPATAIPANAPLKWHDDYLDSTEIARQEQKLLLVWFADPAKSDENEKFAASVLQAESVSPLLANMTLVKVSTTTTIDWKDAEIKLLEHNVFKELLGGPGLAMIDYRDEEAKFYGHVVTVYPFKRGEITAAKLKVLCNLPAGTLTQRTLTFAVRTHTANPASAWSPHSDYLSLEAEKHSQHQASINLQGHHNWESRFHTINAGIGVGGAKEVCAESWPGQTLLDAAEECVHSWSQSSGHWSSVSARHAYFGYDMKRGTNGVWYATGIFGGR